MSMSGLPKALVALLVALMIPAQAALAAAPAEGAEAGTGGIRFSESETLSRSPAEEVRLSSEFFPDPNFLAYLRTLPKLRDVPDGGVIPSERLQEITNIACSNRGIHSLEGVGRFPNVDSVYCDSNDISSLDLSGNPLVSKLSFDNNPMERLTLNPRSSENLRELCCWNTKLSSVDTTALPGLMSLTCGSPELRALDLSNNASLVSLTYFRGGEESVDLSRATGLEALIWSETPVREIDLSPCAPLDYIGLRKNELTVLDLSANGDFRFLSAPENRLVSVHGNPAATYENVDLGSQRARSVGVSAENGSFDMTLLDPKFGQGKVTGLTGATLDGTVLKDARPGSQARYTYTDGGLSVDAALNFTEGNYWTVPVQIVGWSAGDPPNAPYGTPRYGTASFTYGKPGGEFSATPPSEAGQWVCRAFVPGTDEYGPLEEEVSFEISPRPESLPLPDGLTVAYRQTLATVSLPAGYAWVKPGQVVTDDVGVHQYPATHTSSDGVKVPVNLPVTVIPACGPDVCWISPINNEQEARNIRITNGTYALVKGKDYEIRSEVDENLVTLTIRFIGNYYGDITKTFTYVMENSWTTPLSIKDWVEGEPPSKPVAAAKYGEPTFTYFVDGKYQKDPPSEPGRYKVRAVVPGTDNYEDLTAQAPFTIYPAPPSPGELEATYGDALSSVALPKGFSWVSPDTLVGNVGTRDFPATYQGDEPGYPVAKVTLTVKINPKNGELCSISPINNEYESKHIVVKDGQTVLTKGVDYDVDSEVRENVVTVIIRFKGNYFGTVTRTFEYQVENRWIVEPSIENWVTGETPSTPRAEAEYGTPRFTYRVDGKYRSDPPAEPGVYVMRATVPGTAYYPELTAEVAFRVYAGVAPEVSGLEAIYRDRLADVELPEGFAWERPDEMVGNVGVNAFQATYGASGRAADSEYKGGEVELSVAVSPKNGALCDISPITDEYQSKNITITDGDYALVKGVDYSVSSSVRGNRVAVGINFENNYYNTVVEGFSFSFTNEWIEPVAIEGWSYGEPASEPEAEAKFGQPEFRYLVDGAYQEEAPTEAGSYEVEATVPDSVYYNGLESSCAFRITPAVAPIPDGLTAVYRQRLSDVKLGPGYAWKDPSQYVGDAGTNVFDATYEPPEKSNYVGGDIRIPVVVRPKNGNLCEISPITNYYESTHIVITDGDYDLVEGLDYDVAIREDGNQTDVVITFKGNYYSSATRSYSHGTGNYWVKRVSIKNWREGEPPNAPVAEARYGTPAFTYLVDGAYVSSPPTKAGEYFVRATVPATSEYKELTDEKNFEILPASVEPSPAPTASPGPGPSGVPTRPAASPGPGATGFPTPTSGPAESIAPTATPAPTEPPAPTATPEPTPAPPEPIALAVAEGEDARIEETPEGRILLGPSITAGLDGVRVRTVADKLTIVPQGATGMIRIVNRDGIRLTRSSWIATGCRAQLIHPNGEIVDEVTVVLRGDVLGVGVVNISQLVAMARDINGSHELAWPYDIAALFNDNNRVDIADLVDEANILNGTWNPTLAATRRGTVGRQT